MGMNRKCLRVARCGVIVRGLALGLTLSAAPALAADPAPKRAVDVRTNGDVGLTQSFLDAVRAGLPGAERVRDQTPEEADDLALVLSATPDGKKFAWAADLLKVNPGFTPDRVGAFAGKCRADALADCARRVLAETDRAVRKAEKD